MQLNGLQHVGIPTDKFDESRIFYEKLGFKLINSETNNGSRVGFYQLRNLILESWEGKTAGRPGAIDHIALDTDEIEKAFGAVKELNVEFKDDGIHKLPYWEHGIKYFNFFGPNREIFEVCQILK